MNRGEVYDARLEPVEGSEQGGTRPVIIVSRATINTYSPVILAIPCTTYQIALMRNRVSLRKLFLTPTSLGNGSFFNVRNVTIVIII